MKRTLRASVIAISIACLSMNSYAGTIEFEFSDSSGKTYNSIAVEDELIARYGNGVKGVKLLLIETPSFENRSYKTQNRIIDSLPHGEVEELRILFVIACSKGEYKAGYHTSVQTSRKLASGRSGFKIRLLDGRGHIQFESAKPISVKTLRHWVKESDKKSAG